MTYHRSLGQFGPAFSLDTTFSRSSPSPTSTLPANLASNVRFIMEEALKWSPSAPQQFVAQVVGAAVKRLSGERASAAAIRPAAVAALKYLFGLRASREPTGTEGSTVLASAVLIDSFLNAMRLEEATRTTKFATPRAAAEAAEAAEAATQAVVDGFMQRTARVVGRPITKADVRMAFQKARAQMPPTQRSDREKFGPAMTRAALTIAAQRDLKRVAPQLVLLLANPKTDAAVRQEASALAQRKANESSKQTLSIDTGKSTPLLDMGPKRPAIDQYRPPAYEPPAPRDEVPSATYEPPAPRDDAPPAMFVPTPDTSMPSIDSTFAPPGEPFAPPSELPLPSEAPPAEIAEALRPGPGPKKIFGIPWPYLAGVVVIGGVAYFVMSRGGAQTPNRKKRRKR